MSKARAQARAEREAAAARRAADEQVRRGQEAARRARRERRDLAWRRLRLWQHGPGFRRNKERWAALAIVALTLLLLTYFFTGSVTAVLFVVLVLVVAGPALAMLFLDRSRS